MNSNITYNRVTTKSSSLSSSSSSSSSRNSSSTKGVRLNPRRFTVQRLLNARAACVFTIFRRVFLWLKTRLHRKRRSRKRIERSNSGRSTFSCSSRRSFLVQPDEYPYGYGGGYCNYEYRCRTFARSNSFYAEAIADCLDFIKRSSVSSVEQNSPSSSPKKGS